jgi:hypothetical protein
MNVFYKSLVSLKLCLSVLITSPAFADPVVLPTAPQQVDGELDVGAAVSPMKKGQTAPFTGVLISPKALATITVELKTIQEKINIEITRVKAEETARCEFIVENQRIKLSADSMVLQAKNSSLLEQNKILQDRINKEEKSRPNVLLWTAGGFAGGVVVVLLTSFVQNSASN